MNATEGDCLICTRATTDPSLNKFKFFFPVRYWDADKIYCDCDSYGIGRKWHGVGYVLL